MTNSRALLLLAMMSASGLAQPVSQDLPPTLPPTRFDPVLLEPFLDGLLAAQFEAYHLAGAVVAVVKDGQLVIAKGYGHADLDKGIRVDPAGTLFRIASITKLFTATAIMQLVDRGEVQLDQDVNRYLRELKVPGSFSEPVTLAHLLTHTAGFEDRYIGLLPRGSHSSLDLLTLLSRELPRRVRPPGVSASYSNHGVALAGLVVQDVSRQSWEDFVEAGILQPLEMQHTRVRQSETTGLATGYRFSNGTLQAQPFEAVPAAPAGGISSTAEDMARFMIAHLQNGGLGDQRLLREETARLMREVHFSHDPRVSGIGYGFLLNQRNRKLLVGHSGNLSEFHSGLWMIPEENLGVFVSYNAEQGGSARDEFVRAILDFWFPVETDTFPVPRGFAERSLQITGVYRSSRRPVTTLDKVAEIKSYTLVTVVDDGILTAGLTSGESRRWREIDPFMFREKGGRETLLFDLVKGGDRFYLGNAPVLAFERLRWFQTPGFQASLLGGCTLVFLSTLILPILAWLWDKRSDTFLMRRQSSHSSARLTAACVSLLDLAFLIGLLYILRDPLVILEGIPEGLPYLLVLPLISGVLTVVLALLTFIAWRGGYWHISARLHFTLVTLAALGFLWQANYWNFLGWNY